MQKWALIELQIRGDVEDNSKIIFLKKTVCCDPSLEPSRWDGSNDASQNMFMSRNTDNYHKLCYPFLSGALHSYKESHLQNI